MKIQSNNLKGDVFGGVMAAVVALPLALAFGVSSGAGAIAGIYGAVFVGFFAALFGGTKVQISGPTGPMTVVMAAIILNFTSQYPESGLLFAFSVVVLGGIFQIIFGVLKIGKYISMVPYAVISGFMTGIGIIIIILELPALFGMSVDGNVLEVLIRVPNLLGQFNTLEFFIGFCSILFIYFWPKKIGKIMPAQLILLILVTLMTALYLPENSLRLLGEIPTGLPRLHIPVFEFDIIFQMIKAAIILALLGSIDSLLTSLVADNITKTSHDSDQELIGQGVGNVVSGLFGGLPGAGATMRTMVNIKNGGNSQISGMIHALILIAVIMGLGQYASLIPHTLLAAILITVGLNIIDWSFLRRITTFPPLIIITMLTVLFLTIFVNLITAVAVGIIMTSLATIKRMGDLQVKLTKEISPANAADFLSAKELQKFKKEAHNILLFKLHGVLSFAAAREMLKQLGKEGAHKILILDMSQVFMADVTTALTLETIIKRTQLLKKRVMFAGLSEDILSQFELLFDKSLLLEKNHYKTLLEALSHTEDKENL